MSEAPARLARLDPILTQTLRDHVHRQLRHAILSGHYATGERVNERQLAEELGVSTTPLKEALRQLEAEGLVQALPRRGIVIRYGQVWAEEMILARAALESMVAHLAARRIGAAATSGLHDTVERMNSATASGDVEALIALNEVFHEQIHVASRCEYLVHLLERQRFYDDGTRRVIHSDPAERERAFAEHRAIALAIAAHDEGAAERAMRDHVVRSGEHYIALVFSQSSMKDASQ